MKIILRVKNPDDSVYALRAALSLDRDGHDVCAYGYGDPEVCVVLARRNKSSITATTQDYYE